MNRTSWLGILVVVSFAAVLARGEPLDLEADYRIQHADLVTQMKDRSWCDRVAAQTLHPASLIAEPAPIRTAARDGVSGRPPPARLAGRLPCSWSTASALHASTQAKHSEQMPQARQRSASRLACSSL